MTTPQDIPDNGIAIIGLSGRFPGANNVAEFWRLLVEGREGISDLTLEECLAAGASREQCADPAHRRRAGVVAAIDQFDAAYFGLQRLESQAMDPQLRLSLECALEALEDGGIDPARFDGAIGVYAGASDSSYLANNLHKHPNVMEALGPMKSMVGTSSAFLATTIAYKLNLRGPTISLQTACSTGAVAAHMAVQGLLAGECDMALAGAATINVKQGQGYRYVEGGIMARDGYCRPFDAAASGTLPGNGVGMLLLCRLADAMQMNCQIYAVIRGSATNNDGAQKVGFAAPSVQGQARVIAEALMVAGVGADSIGYVETHGTGTALGDPIEFDALNRVFQRDQAALGACGIGSVKSNIGHLDSAAGVASLIKVALALKHQIIPRSLHFSQPHPALDMAHSPFYMVSENHSWHQLPRRAGVSAFGVGGANAHLVLEEAPAMPVRAAQDKAAVHILPLAAHSAVALAQSAQNLAAALQKGDLRLDDVAFTLQQGRRELPYRQAFAADSLEAAIRQLQAGVPAVRAADNAPEVAFVFSGQGSQALYMGQALYDAWPPFKEAFDACNEWIKRYADIDMLSLLYPAAAQREQAQARLARTRYAQPAIFTLSYCLAQAWQSVGVRPAAMIGHSIGELVAACLAGVFSLQDALYLVCERAAAMDECEGEGGMLAVMAPAASMRQYCGTDLALAADNAPQRCVLSGSLEALAALREKLQAQGVAFTPLQTSHAFHSPLMAPASRRFAAALAKVQKNVPSQAWISNRSGLPITAQEAQDDAYWLAHMLETVHFGSGIGHLAQNGIRVFLEVGPGQALTRLNQQNLNQGGQALASLPAHGAQAQAGELQTLCATAGHLWSLGVTLDWDNLPGSNQEACRVSLPTYPFQRESYWLEAKADAPQEAAPATANADAAPAAAYESAYGMAVRKTASVQDWFYVHGWQRSPAARLLDHIDLATYAGVWLVWHEASGISQALAQRLQAQGQKVISITPAAHNQKRDAQTYLLNPQTADSYPWLLEELTQDKLVPTNVVHMGLTCAATQTLSPEQAGQLGICSLFGLLQAMEGKKIRTLVNFSVFATHALNVGGNDPVQPIRAAAAGFCKSLPQDFKHMTAQFIDIGPLPQPGSVQAVALLDQLQDELCAIPYDQLLAYRGRARWARSYPLLPMPPAASPSWTEQSHLLLLAATPLVARTLLRSLRLPGRVICRTTLLMPPAVLDAPTRAALSSEFGSENVRIAGCDLAEEGQFARLLDEAEAAFGPLHSVLCRWFEFDDLRAFCHQIDAPQLQQRIETTARHLHSMAQALGQREIECVLFFSSIITALAGIGASAIFAGYTAFDECIEKIANENGQRWISLDGEGWFEEDLLPGGMTAAGRSAVDNPGMMTLEELAQVIDHTLALSSMSQTRVIATPMSIPAREEWVRRNILKHNRKVSGGAHAAPVKAATPAQILQYPAASAGTVSANAGGGAFAAGSTQQRLAAIIKGLTGADVVNEQQMLYEAGWDSLVVLQAFQKLRAEFHLDVPIRSLLEVGTLGDLSALIENRRPDSVSLQASAAEEFDVSSAHGLAQKLLSQLLALSDAEVQQRLAAGGYQAGASAW